jgi:hypothetical protein
MDNLDYDQLRALLDSVFALRDDERWLTLLVDLPDERVPDTDAWRDRRAIASEWFALLRAGRSALPFTDAVCCTYPNVGSNNNDLPRLASVTREGIGGFGSAEGDARMEMRTILESSSVVLAPTQLSATAPLKVLARELGFRGATLPGFSRQMLPVLALDYEKVNARVVEFRDRMDRAEGVAVRLVADGR